MDLNIINKLCNMSIEQLSDWIETQAYSEKELETFINGKKMIDRLLEFSANNLSNRVMIGLIAYSIYKVKGGK